jgi:NADH-quinone oxidoreductase subunit J
MTPVATPLFFYAFAGIAIVSALLVVTQRNAVHSAISLIFTLLSLAGLYLMLYAPFVAGVQIILYVGGIMVLFLFVIMLVNLERSMKEERFNQQWHVALMAAGALAAMFFVVFKGAQSVFPQRVLQFPENQNTQQLALLLYGKYLLPFELASVLLLVAMVGAVIMAKKKI